jgi:hypothetical protein
MMNESLSNYSPERPLILLTDHPPRAGGGGAVILRSLIGEADRARILWLSLSPDKPGTTPDGPSQALRSGSARVASLLKRRSMLTDSILAAQLAAEVRAIAAERKARAVWAVMHGAVVHVAAHLTGRADLPVHLTVHDDPAYGVALMSTRYLAMVPLIERDVRRSLRAARSVDVVCEDMGKRYRERYGVSSTVTHRGMSRPIEPSATHDDQVLEVGVLGNTYGYTQLPVLAEAIIAAAREAGVPGRLVVLGQGNGPRLKSDFAGRLDVEVTGHLAEPAAVERLRRCFALYLNYPFGLRAAVLRQTSFPTKLTTYIQAARPLLVHAPSDSSIRFLSGRAFADYAAWWDDKSVESGARALVQAWRSPQLRLSRHEAAETIRRTYYDLAPNRASLFAALNALVG